MIIPVFAAIDQAQNNLLFSMTNRHRLLEKPCSTQPTPPRWSDPAREPLNNSVPALDCRKVLSHEAGLQA